MFKWYEREQFSLKIKQVHAFARMLSDDIPTNFDQLH